VKNFLLSFALLFVMLAPPAASAAGDPGGGIPPGTDPAQEFVRLMCALTGLEFYCSRVVADPPGGGN
jgi:hypothetical protein